MLIGAFFILAGSIGILRLPDIYNRLHAATKSATLGVMSIVLAALLLFGAVDGVYSGKMMLTILFVFITAPIGAQMISRSAYQIGVGLWDKSVQDDMKGYYGKVKPGRDSDY